MDETGHIFEPLDARRRAWENRVLQYSRDANYISPEQYDRITEAVKNHLPLSRIQEPDAFSGNSKSSGSILKKFYGSETDILDPFVQTFKNAELLIRKQMPIR